MNRLFLAIGLFAGLATNPGFGQSTNAAEANIPFDFSVGDASFRAGKYVLRQNSTNGVLSVQSKNGSQGAFVLTTPKIANAGKPLEYVLRFRCYGDQRFLSEVWTGSETGRTVPITHKEKVVARNYLPNIADNTAVATNRVSPHGAR